MDPLEKKKPQFIVDPQLVKAVSAIGLHVNPGDLLRDNVRETHEATPGAGSLVFQEPNRVIEDRQVVEFGGQGASGFNRSGETLTASTFSRLLMSRDVRFLRCRGRKWDFVSGGQGLFNPLKATEDEAIVPLLGGIYVNGEDITKDQAKMERLGLSIVRDEEGREVTYPAFVIGGRSVMWPFKGQVPAFKTKEGGYNCISFDRLQGIFRKQLGAEGEGKVREAVNARMKADWERKSDGLTREEYQRRNFEDTYVLSSIFTFQKGGGDDAKLFPIVAVQLKGVGVNKYRYHFNRVETDGRVQLQPGDMLLKPSNQSEARRISTVTDFTFVQRPGYDGKSGILLDVRHEAFDKSPTGSIYSEEKGIERAQMLWSAGAEMSEIPMGSMRLISKIDVDAACGKPTGMVCEEIVITQKAVLDDTNRLEILSKGDSTAGQPNNDFIHLMQRDFGGYSDENRDTYLRGLCEVVGKNMRVCLRNKLTTTNEQNTADNLSIYGRIKDPQSFVDMESRYQVRPLIRQWLTDVSDVAASGGIGSNDFLRSEHFKTLAVSFLGKTDGEAAYLQIQDHIAGKNKWKPTKDAMSPYDFTTVELSRRIVQQGLRADGKRLDRKALYKRLKDDKLFRTYAWFKDATSSQLKALAPGFSGDITITIKTPTKPLGKPVTFKSDSLYDHLQRAFIECEVLRDEPTMAHDLDQSLRPYREGMPLERLPPPKKK